MHRSRILLPPREPKTFNSRSSVHILPLEALLLQLTWQGSRAKGKLVCLWEPNRRIITALWE